MDVWDSPLWFLLPTVVLVVGSFWIAKRDKHK